MGTDPSVRLRLFRKIRGPSSIYGFVPLVRNHEAYLFGEAARPRSTRESDRSEPGAIPSRLTWNNVSYASKRSSDPAEGRDRILASLDPY